MTLNLDRIYDEFDLRTVARAMNEQGFYVFGNRLDSDSLPPLRDRIDELSEADGTEINYAGSEHRVWDAENRSREFADFQKLSNWIMPQIYGSPYPSHTVLAIRNRPISSEAPLTNVRWHLDSFRTQLKLFAFLTDVTEENGPLEFIPGTHKAAFKWPAIPWIGLAGPSDLINRSSRRRTWQSIHDKQIEKVRRRGYEVRSMTVQAGTLVLVDTSGLHRARPCLEGERYAVTVYHR